MIGKLEYIGNDINNGIKIDYKKVNEYYKKLKCPPEFYNPTKTPFDKCKWVVNMSERNTGKTTNWILWGMCANWLYGVEIQYLRQNEESIAPKNIRDIFRPILLNGYVGKVTAGKYNSITYKARRWYYCNTDETGEVVEIAPDYFMIDLVVSKSIDYKSSYNSPKGDLVIFDEFIGNYYLPNEFIMLCDLLKTIFRERQSPIVVLLANTVNKQSTYFHELSIYDKIQNMKLGDSLLVTTPKGTNIYVEIITRGKYIGKRSIVNKLFYGFNNPLLASITGDGWSVYNYPHITDIEASLVFRNYYISHNNKYINLELYTSGSLGMFVKVHESTKIYDDSIIYTINNITSRNERYKYGYTRIDSILWSLYTRNKWYYSTNDVGDVVHDFVSQAKKL